MSGAFLSRLVLSPLSREVRRDLADVQALHRRVMSGFPAVDGKARVAHGVLYRVEPGPGGVSLLVQSRVPPDWGELPAGYVQEDWLEAATAIATTRLDGLLAGFAVGQTLRFRLRANPTRCIDSKSGPDGARRRGKRVPLRKEESQLAWLGRKGRAHGFELVEVRRSPAEGHVGDVLAREPAKVVGFRAGQRVTLEGVVFEGRLRVVDVQRFRAAVLEGVGRGRAYGFGLLSVAPERG